MEEKVGLASEHVKITVTSNETPNCGGRTFDVKADPDPVIFKLSEHPQAFTIHWKVVTPGYSFPTGTVVSDPTPQNANSPAGEINQCGAGGLAMNCNNNSKSKGSWKYTIPSLRDKDGCTVPPKDPVISND